MRASVGGRNELAARVQQALAAADQEGSRAYCQRGRQLRRSNVAEQSRDGWVHAQAEQLWQILSPSQTGDSQEDSIHGRDDTDER